MKLNTSANSNFNQCEFYVEGMHCAACELLIERKLAKFKGVKNVEAILTKNKVFLKLDKNINPEEIRADLSKLIEKDGYRLLSEKPKSSKINWKDLGIAAIIGGILILAFLLIQKLGLINVLNNGKFNYPLVIFIGFIASLSTCMAVVGGLVLSLSSSYAKKQQVKAMVLFHFSRIISFFILGGVIGIIGSAFTLTEVTSLVLNLILFVVMLVMGINLLDIFPWAKKLQLSMPKFIGKKTLELERDTENIFTPILLGAATFFLPCGFTQSMQLYALSTGSLLNGAMTMLLFALGTLPVLALISFASIRLAKTLQSGLFFKVAGILILFFALFNFIAALTAIGFIKPIFNI